MIKVILGEVKTQDEKPFPKLMIRKDDKDYTLILAISKEGNDIEGVCLDTNCMGDVIGEYCTYWSAQLLTDYNESITLQNL